MVYALQKFKHYLLGKHFKMFTDHSSLKYLLNKTVLGGESIDGYCCFRNLTLK
jgi:hypothetical protein